MPLALRFALRELRGGLTGLRLLAVCLVLGVAALASVGSLSSAIVASLSAQGSEILGGDAAVTLTGRSASPEERAAFDQYGTVSEGVRMRSMVGRAGSDNRILGELKAVDGQYPLYGKVELVGGGTLDAALAGPSAVVAQALADQLGLKVGDRIELGQSTLKVTAIIASEPDRAGEGFSLGPTVMIAMASLPETGLVQPGSLMRVSYRIKMPVGADAGAVKPALNTAFPDAGWQVQDRSNGAPGVRRFVERMGQFLMLVGLTSLVVAGVGVGNGVASYLDAKSATIATFKTLGATSTLIFQSYFLQIGIVALGAVGIGVGIGAFAPMLVARVAGDALPVAPVIGIFPGALISAAAYGLLIAAAFALWPLARAQSLPAARLFRSVVDGGGRAPYWVFAATFAAAAAIVVIALMGAREPMFAAIFIASASGLLALLTGLAAAIRWLAARAPRPRGVLQRLALANLHRPGSLVRQLIVALGLGLTLFATLAVIETNLGNEIARTVPKKAPTFFFLDIPKDEAAAFAAQIRTASPSAGLRLVPSLRGPVTAVNGTPVSQLKNVPDGAWFLRGDRGLTWSSGVPEGNRVTDGAWWPKDYAGPPLVSLDAEAAKAAGLKVGDTLTVSVLGVEITARIANLRVIDWDSLGFNFALVFDQNSLGNAPYSYMATAEVPASEERQVYTAMTRAFPTVSVIKVKDVIGTVATLLEQIATAIRAAASVAVAAGIAVLIGALAAGRRARTYDAVILKVLGATRGQMLRATLLEYGLLASIVALLAVALGGLAGWIVVVQVFEFTWQPSWLVVLATVLLGAAVTIGLGLAGSWRALSVRPNQVLRTL